MAGKSFLFVCGTHRSGTTALTDLLNSHPRILLGQERFYNLVDDRKFHKWDNEQFSPRVFLNPVESETHNFQWKQDIQYYTGLWAKYLMAKVIGDKVPDYFLYIDHLASAFGSAKFLFISRNPIDVANSWNARFHDPDDTVWSSDYASAIESWNYAHCVVSERYPHLAKRIAVVSYERLFSYDEEYLDRLAKFIGASEESRPMFEFYKSQTKNWTALARKARSHLTREQVSYIERNAKTSVREELLSKYGL